MSENLDADIKKAAKEIVVSKEAQKRIKAIGGWGIFLAIYGFIFSLFLLYSSYNYFSSISQLERMYSDAGMYGGMMNDAIFKMKVIASILLLVGIIMILPGIFLIRFNVFSRRSFESSDQYDFDDSLKYLKYTFIFGGCYCMLTLLAIAYLLYNEGSRMF